MKGTKEPHDKVNNMKEITALGITAPGMNVSSRKSFLQPYSFNH